MEERMATFKEIKLTQGSLCPSCSSPNKCAMEAGKSANLCWCMTLGKPYSPETNYETCMCKRCLTTTQI